MKTTFLMVVISLNFLFFSCEKNDVNLEDLYGSLPDIEYVSQNYTVNDISFDGKKYFDPPNPRTGGKKEPKYLKYKDNNLDTIYNRYGNSVLIIFAVDTKIGDVCSVYEGQGDVGQLVYINGELIEMEPFYALIDLKIKENYFIFVLANQVQKKYVLYKP